MSEQEQVIEPVVETETTPEAEPAVEPVIESSPIPEMDFSDFGIQQEQEPADYQDIINRLAESAAEKATARLVQELSAKKQATLNNEDDDEELIITKKDLADYEARILEKINQKAQATKEAEDYINQNVNASNQVRASYADKFSKALDSVGFSLQENPALQSSADILWKQMHLEEAVRLGRPLHMPVLTREETQDLAQRHWKTFSEIYLSGQSLPKTKSQTAPLTAAGSAQVLATNDRPVSDEMKAFAEKKAAGKVSSLEALKFYNKIK